jgi:site-specific recombinase XerD
MRAADSPSLPPVLAGMPRADAMEWLSRVYDSMDAGDVVWDDTQLVERFLAQCSRTNSPETKAGYERELHAFQSWRWNRAMLRAPGHPTPLRAVSPQEAQDWVDHEREQVSEGRRQARSFNRRVAAVSALYRWASEPSRSGFTAALKWGDVETLDGGDGQIHLIGKGSKARTVRVSVATLMLFNAIRSEGSGEDDWVFPSERRGSGHLTRQAIGSRVRHWGQVALGPEARVWPHRLRSSHATHAIREGVDVFTLQSTLGHASTSTTQGYVAANPADSSSLRLG